ncbi:chromate resistance protein ChrB domain-containing protein [Herbaspirillum huttiense]|uniref:chromate resistance protein ChrB domain-containing protein n=1 Tax=Herbaspirillum huttiense TaxID=863372 RepID=UPI003877A9FA
MNSSSIRWHLLIASLPTTSATARMRLWRALKALGCAPLRDGAYLLPELPRHAETLAELAEQTNFEGGEAWLVRVEPRNEVDEQAFRARFDRTKEHGEFLELVVEAKKGLASQTPTDIAKTLKKLAKERDAIERIDFFPNEASLDASAAWADFAEKANAILSPGEPQPQTRDLQVLQAQEYQGRTWATRRRLWVDRVASAWLIQRFIDPKARFLWLDSPSDCPSDALGFDFNDATFTHVGDKVTFEVLVASFQLPPTPGIEKLSSLVHALDAGGEAPLEAAGFEAILTGARTRLADDDAFLLEVGTILDSLYAHYSKEAP